MSRQTRQLLGGLLFKRNIWRVMMLGWILALVWLSLIFLSPLPSKYPQPLVVQRGQRWVSVLHQLSAQSPLSFPIWQYRLLARCLGWGDALLTGEYQMHASMTVGQLLYHLHTGTGKVVYRVDIRAGETAQAVWQRFLHRSELLREPSCQLNRDWAGQLLPDSWGFYRGDGVCALLERAHRHWIRQAIPLWMARSPGLPYRSLHEATVMASLIVREASSLADKQGVAAVLINRLRRHWRLQVDPTVSYALGQSFHQPLSAHDFRVDSLYNTYRYGGLPPGPIATTTMEDLWAALHPAKLTALYYVSNGQGGHSFSDDFQAHLKAVRRYRQQRDAALHQARG